LGSFDVELTRRFKGILKVETLAKIGVEDTELNIRNKVSRGMLTAVFLVQCLESIGAREIRL
jgi:hypothetical protein